MKRLLLASLCLASTAGAVPLAVTHSGRLLDASDTPVTQTQVQLSFSIWSHALATEPEFKAFPSSGEFSCTTDVLKGFYTVVFGEPTCGPGLGSDTFPVGQARYLEISVGGAKLSPRLRIGSVPTAALAASAMDSEKLSGKTLADLDARYAPATGASYVALQATPGAAQTGGITVSGPIAGASFIGDGSKLTGLDPAKLSGPLPGALLKGSYGEAITLGNGANSFAGTFDGTHTGLGRGLTEVDAQKLGGRLDTAYALKTDLTPLALKADLTPLALKADLDGYLPKAANGTVKLAGGTSGTCDSTNPGTVRWNGANFEGCNGAKWVRLDNPPVPVITQVAPATGPFEGGTTITISGENFEGPAKVFVGGVEATSVTLVNGGSITAVTPLALKSGANDVRVQVGSGASALSSAGFAYGVSGLVKASALANCKAHKAAGASADGTYFIDPTGGSTNDALQVYCDMTTDGGGWTLAGFSQAGSPHKNMYSFKCGGGVYHPTNRNDSGAIAAVDLARASTEVLFAQSASTTNVTGNINAYEYVSKFGIPDPSAITFNSHSFHTGYSSQTCVAVNVTQIKGGSGTLTRYTLKQSLGATWGDSFPTGYGAVPNSACTSSYSAGPYTQSIHSGAGRASGTTVSCDVTDGSVTYNHQGIYLPNSVSASGTTSIWFR